MQPCELDNNGFRDNKENTEQNPGNVKQTTYGKTWRQCKIAGQ